MTQWVSLGLFKETWIRVCIQKHGSLIPTGLKKTSFPHFVNHYLHIDTQERVRPHKTLHHPREKVDGLSLVVICNNHSFSEFECSRPHAQKEAFPITSSPSFISGIIGIASFVVFPEPCSGWCRCSFYVWHSTVIYFQFHDHWWVSAVITDNCQRKLLRSSVQHH